ncbi:MAG: lysoplasmalogenase [Erysipelotrichaceae bacterium]|nr:lysoplasmalogenase [Erysipelotrichaceae bacterium]
MDSRIILIAVTGIILQAAFIMVEHKEKYVLADILKGLASLMFVIIGLIGYKQFTTDSFGLKIVIGLLFGLIGDILLNLRFVFEKIGQKIFLVGILAFLIGHILYLLALIPIAVNLLLCVAIGALLAGLLLAYIFKTMEVKKAFKIFGVFYLGAVIIMTVIAIGIALSTGIRHDVIYAIGAILFTASDIVLIFNTFSGTTKFSLRITNLSLYYIGQLLIAFSLFFIR